MRADVAQSTVSLVLSGNPRVSRETRARVERAMQELNYQPNAGARTLRTARTNVIALIVHLGPEADARESVPYIDSIVDQARRMDYDVVLSTVREGPAGLRRLAGRAICDAFILMDVETRDDRVPAAAELGLPVVLMGRPDDSHGLDVADFDTRRAAHMLVDDLVATGHRRITVVGEAAGRAQFQFVTDFQEGARQRAAEHGILVRIVTRPEDGWPGILAGADELLTGQDERLGLITRAPQVTEWVVQLLRQRGLVPGQDVSLASFCTDESAVSHALPVTNVSPQPEAVSSLAVRLLANRLQDPTAPPITSLVEPSALVRRATTTPAGRA